jgi:hypothetical protein
VPKIVNFSESWQKCLIERNVATFHTTSKWEISNMLNVCTYLRYHIKEHKEVHEHCKPARVMGQSGSKSQIGEQNRASESGNFKRQPKGKKLKNKCTSILIIHSAELAP